MIYTIIFYTMLQFSEQPITIICDIKEDGVRECVTYTDAEICLPVMPIENMSRITKTPEVYCGYDKNGEAVYWAD